MVADATAGDVALTRSDRAARVCVVVGVAAAVAFAAWQFAMPDGFVSVRGLNPRAVVEWRTRFRVGAPALSLSVYAAVFRGLIVLGWLAYAGLMWCAYRRARLTRAWTWGAAGAAIAVLAVAMPPSLSTDVFAYVGYGRLAVVHGLNPHLHTQLDLVRLGDPTAAYLHWPISSPYGPLWTLMSMAIVAAAPAGAVWGPVLLLKCCAGAALLGAAALAQSLVRRVDAPRADATFVLVALNPLLLIEGPGNGHNDVLMVALLLGGFAALGRGRMILAAALVGASAAIKLVPLVVVPWLAVVAARGATRSGWGQRLLAAGVVLVVVAAVLVGALAPFWSGADTLRGLGARWRAAGPASWASWPAVLVFLWGTAAVLLGKGDPIFRLASVWAFVALAIMLFVAGMWFPWYLAWIWPVAVLRASRLHLALVAFTWPFSLLLMLAYAWPP